MDQILTPRELSTLIQTLQIALLVGLFATVVGTFVSVITHLFLSRFQKLIDLTLLISLLIPPLFHAIAWLNGFYFLTKLGILSLTYLPILRSPLGVIFVLTITNIPISYFITKLAMQNVPTSSWQSLILTKPTNGSTIRFILPLLKSTTALSFLLITILTFNIFDVPAFYEVNVFVMEIFTQFSARFNTTRAILLSVLPVIVTTTLAIIAYKRYFRNNPIFSSTRSFSSTIPKLDSRLASFIGTGVVITILLICFIFPVLSIFQASNLPHITFWQDLIASRDAILSTLQLMLVATPILIVSGLLGAYLLHKFPQLRLILFTLFMLPAITYGIIFIYLFNRSSLNSIYQTPILLVFAYTIRFFPLITELIATQLNRINPHLLWAAKLHQHIGDKFIQRILIPLIRPALISASMIGAWLVVTELPITLLLQPAGSQTLISRVFILLHYGSQTTMNTLVVAIIALGIIPLIIFWRRIQSSHD